MCQFWVGFDWLIILLIMDCVFLPLSIPGNLCFEPDITNYILLGAEYFCVPINIFELCFGVQLNYMETLTLWVWSSSFVRGIHNSVSSRANYFSRLRKDIYQYSAQWPKNYTFFHSVLWKQALSLILYKYWTLFFNFFQWFPAPPPPPHRPQLMSPHRYSNQCSAEYQGGLCRQPGFSLGTVVSC